jgi:hypothetical protein
MENYSFRDFFLDSQPALLVDLYMLRRLNFTSEEFQSKFDQLEKMSTNQHSISTDAYDFNIYLE